MSKAKFKQLTRRGDWWDSQGYGVVGQQHPGPDPNQPIVQRRPRLGSPSAPSSPAASTPPADNLIRPDTLLTSLQAHTVKRIVAGELPSGTSATRYLKEIREMVRHASARLYVGITQDGATAAVMATPTLTLFRTGHGVASCIVVLYDADSGVIDSGYPVQRSYFDQGKLFLHWDRTHLVR
jgi:hypothetical protein